MSDKRYSADRYHPPPLTYDRYRTIQTVRIQTETTYEPVLQRVVTRNRTLSSASADESITTTRQTVDVARLVEQIEKQNSMQNRMFLPITRLELHKSR